MDDPTFILELVGLFLTLMVLLYMIVGDNALFRIVTYTFVGVASGYVTVLILFQVLLPRMFTIINSGSWAYMIPFVLGLLLLFKLSPRLSWVASLPLAALVGVGAAVAVGGAIFGTLFGQVLGTVGMFSARGDGAAARFLEGIFLLVGIISTLAYFQFSARTRPVVSADAAAPADGVGVSTAARRTLSLELLARAGQVFIGITLGAMFAGVYTAAITALIERIGFVIDVVNKAMGKLF
jgi:hypothetical protein